MASLPQQDRYYLITTLRTASNLLIKMLNLDDQTSILKHGHLAGYFFVEYMNIGKELNIRGKHIDERSEEENAKAKECLQKCFDKLQEYLDKCKTENKLPWIKEHSSFITDFTAATRFAFKDENVKSDPIRVDVGSAYGKELTWSANNLTVFPDQFLRTWKPTLLVRHPALVFPSQYRNLGEIGMVQGDESLAMTMTFVWQRNLYDFYCEQFGKPATDDADTAGFPLVLDADDVIGSPEVVKRYTALVGLDPEKLKFSWEQATEEDLSKFRFEATKKMLDTMHGSTGIIKGKSSVGIKIDEEVQKWKEEFGQEEGSKLEKWVKDAMPDYEYLTARRLRPSKD